MAFGARWIAAAAIGGVVSLGSITPGHARIESGLLTCEVTGGFALVISSPRQLHCVFQKTNGLSEAYSGIIREFGLDLGATGAGVIAWSVEAETMELPPGVLAGSYSGAEVGATVIAGGAVRALVGGSQRTISLQPLSVEGDVGLNVAVGIATMELYPLFRATSVPSRARIPAAGLSYSAVPHAQQAPHYGCGSYTHLMRGQTLYGLAHTCGVTVDALLEANPQISDVRNVTAGSLIYLPSHHRAASSCGSRIVLHEDESLEHLAWRCGVTLHALLVANPSVRDVSMLQPGLVLAIPEQRRTASAPVIFTRTAAEIAPARPERPTRPDPNQKMAQSAKDGTRSEQVRFKPGQTRTTISGRITGYESTLYRVGAEAGQTMAVALKPSNLATYFNVYEPGKGPGDEALATGGTTGPMVPDVNMFKGKLPTSGTYTISVYMMRSAARRNEQSNYALDVSISALSDASRQSPVQRDYADGLQGGPDFWEITARLGATVSLRTSPSGAAPVIGSVSGGTVLRNLGCRMAEGRRWCHVETPSAPRLSGWTVGDSLRESSYGGSQSQPKAGAPGNFDRPIGGVRPRGSGFTATGMIPCARVAGQPMTSCDFGVVRKGNGNGILTVFWPDGGNRVIFFENGKPSSFDHSQADGNSEMTVNRDSDLLSVRIGEQRFEIPDAVISG